LAIVWRPAHILLNRRSIRAARARTSTADLHSLPHAS
jgi:hypothetical protein